MTDFETTIAEIRSGNIERQSELAQRLSPELSNHAILAMAIYSAEESAS